MNKAISVQAKEDFKLKVEFEDGRVVLYDVKPMFALVPAFRELQNDSELYRSVKVADEGKMVSWKDNLNLDATNIWANGVLVEYTKKPNIRRLLAYKLQLARRYAGITQKELAEKTGIYQADISKLERGMGNPSIHTLERLADGLGMDLYIDLRRPAGTEMTAAEIGSVGMKTDESTEKIFVHKTLEERAAEYGGKLNLDGEYDWGEPVGREVW